MALRSACRGLAQRLTGGSALALRDTGCATIAGALQRTFAKGEHRDRLQLPRTPRRVPLDASETLRSIPLGFLRGRGFPRLASWRLGAPGTRGVWGTPPALSATPPGLFKGGSFPSTTKADGRLPIFVHEMRDSPRVGPGRRAIPATRPAPWAPLGGNIRSDGALEVPSPQSGRVVDH